MNGISFLKPETKLSANPEFHNNQKYSSRVKAKNSISEQRYYKRNIKRKKWSYTKMYIILAIISTKRILKMHNQQANIGKMIKKFLVNINKARNIKVNTELLRKIENNYWDDSYKLNLTEIALYINVLNTPTKGYYHQTEYQSKYHSCYKRHAEI